MLIITEVEAGIMQRLWTSTLLKAFRQSVNPNLCHIQKCSVLTWQLHNKPALILSSVNLKFRTLQTGVVNSDESGRRTKNSVETTKDTNYVGGVHPSRLHHRQRNAGRSNQAKRTQRTYIDKERAIEEGYMQDYERTKRYTKRSIEYEERTSEGVDTGGDEAKMDEGDTFGNLTDRFDTMVM